jgi:hypothetical protein
MLRDVLRRLVVISCYYFSNGLVGIRKHTKCFSQDRMSLGVFVGSATEPIVGYYYKPLERLRNS